MIKSSVQKLFFSYLKKISVKFIMLKNPLTLDHDCRLSKGGAQGIEILNKKILLKIVYGCVSSTITENQIGTVLL